MCRRLYVHLLAIGLAEVALVGLGPVGVVGGSAGHGECVCVMHLIQYNGEVKREGWWWWC